ncbi:MAG: hypothetical protein JXB36_08365 [Gammaproteobacteria bacterium]|nr:hypothetical protein [Gammaproteobacteria bacterium]
MTGDAGFTRVLALALLTAILPYPARAQECSRACLTGLMDTFLEALEARDPSDLPLAPSMRYTENGQDIALDDGLWKTFTRSSGYRLYVPDTDAGQVVFLGVIGENEESVIAHFRMKVEGRQIAEVEALLARGSTMAALENLVEPKPIYLETLPPDQRRSRADMIAITNAYFTGLDTENSGANVPFHEDCQRQENGVILANSPDPDAGEMQRLGCKAQFDTGFSTIVTDVRERRFVAIDEERGLSYALVFFDHDGSPKTMGGVGGVTRDVQAPFNRPMTLMIGELFKIVDGRIRQIEAIIVQVPYGMPSGWGNAEASAQPAQLAAQRAATASARSPAAPEASPPAAACDRACLRDFVDRYVAALVANDHTQAPFAADAKFTENAQVLELGDALWRTASAGPDGYELVAADPMTGNAAFYMIMEESGSPIWLTGRLQVENAEITELETVVVRSGGGFAGFDHERPDPLWNEVVPPERRNTREELVDAAERYMDALEQNLVDHARFDESCNRLENGVVTANNPQGQGIGAMTCRDNINSGMWVYITEIAPRRYLVMDEERGLVMGMFMFHHDGSHDHAIVDGERVEYSGATRRPFTTVIPEMFKVMDGRIYRITASMVAIPYRSDSGWD